MLSKGDIGKIGGSVVALGGSWVAPGNSWVALGGLGLLLGRSWVALGSSRVPRGRSWCSRAILGSSLEGCCRAWGLPKGAFSMYKGCSFATEKGTRVQKKRKGAQNIKNVAVAIVLRVFLNKSCCNRQNVEGTPPVC